MRAASEAIDPESPESNVRYRRFGKTNLHLSVFSLGTMRYLEQEEVAIATVQAAVAAGINHIETARAYGNSEVYLGKALRSPLVGSREQLHLTSKLLPTPDAAAADRSIDESLERLQTNYLDCLAVHGINTWEHLDWVLAANGCMKAIQQALEDGRIRHVGFSSHGSLELILAAIASDRFEFVNLHYYYFFQRHAPAVVQAFQKDMGVFIISPADKGGQLFQPPPRLEHLCHPFSPLALTYRFLLSDRRVTTLSLGAANPQELELALQWGDRDEPLSPLETEVFQRLETAMDGALGGDRCRQCYQCLPCPEDIHIPEVLRLRNLTVGYDMTAFGQYRYRMFENAGHWFPGRRGDRCTECGDCLPRCPEHLDIPALLKDTHVRLHGKPRRRLWE